MYKNILLPIDLNSIETQETAVGMAVQLAQTFGAKLHVMSVVPNFGVGVVSTFFPEDYEQKVMTAADAELQDFLRQRMPEGIEVDHAVANGTIYKEVLDFAGQIQADLIVMASHRPELKDYLIGPNAARVVRHADCSVLVVRD
jgi:nucleotide-binding universal stress UspA family protein